jgi:hypothetical protein
VFLKKIYNACLEKERFMRTFLLTYLLLTIHLNLGANITIPDKFYVDQAWTYTDNTISSIRNDEEEIGLFRLHLSGDILSGRVPQYDLYTSKGGLAAIATIGITDQSNRVVFNVLDKEGFFLGTIEEDWENSWLQPIIEIYSDNYDLIAKIENNFCYTVSFNDPTDNHVLATLSSSPFSWTWTAKVNKSQSIKQLDSRLFFLSTIISISCIKHSYKLSQKP